MALVINTSAPTAARRELVDHAFGQSTARSEFVDCPLELPLVTAMTATVVIVAGQIVFKPTRSLLRHD
jgi:hypothetical protein